MDQCWTEWHFDDLARFLADDVVFVPPDGDARLDGQEAAIDRYRAFMGSCRLRRFETAGRIVTRHGPVAVVEYRWKMAWETGGAVEQASGREILVLAAPADDWRNQIPR